MAFAVAVHEPVQSALHFVVQSSVVGIDTHCVLQWSSQHALHDAWQSVDEDDDEEEDVPPSGEVPEDEDEEELDVQDELHPDSQRDVQSVVQSRAGGLVEQLVEQLDWQLEPQLASADAEHFESHCFSSVAAHASRTPPKRNVSSNCFGGRGCTARWLRCRCSRTRRSWRRVCRPWQRDHAGDREGSDCEGRECAANALGDRFHAG